MLKQSLERRQPAERQTSSLLPRQGVGLEGGLVLMHNRVFGPRGAPIGMCHSKDLIAAFELAGGGGGGAVRVDEDVFDDAGEVVAWDRIVGRVRFGPCQCIADGGCGFHSDEDFSRARRFGDWDLVEPQRRWWSWVGGGVGL